MKWLSRSSLLGCVALNGTATSPSWARLTILERKVETLGILGVETAYFSRALRGLAMSRLRFLGSRAVRPQLDLLSQRDGPFVIALLGEKDRGERVMEVRRLPVRIGADRRTDSVSASLLACKASPRILCARASTRQSLRANSMADWLAFLYTFMPIIACARH